MIRHRKSRSNSCPSASVTIAQTVSPKYYCLCGLSTKYQSQPNKERNHHSTTWGCQIWRAQKKKRISKLGAVTWSSDLTGCSCTIGLISLQLGVVNFKGYTPIHASPVYCSVAGSCNSRPAAQGFQNLAHNW